MLSDIYVWYNFITKKTNQTSVYRYVVVDDTAGHNLPDKSCVADTAMQIELA